METLLNGQHLDMNGENTESLGLMIATEEPLPEPFPLGLYHNAVRLGRDLLDREVGVGGYLIIMLLLIVMFVAYGYFFGYPFHGAAGPD